MGKILVVDDEPNLVKMIKSRLEAHDYEVVTALDGKEGLKKAEEEIPDLIILDILMPNMDGSEMAAALRDKPITSNIPVIFLTCLVKKPEEQRIKSSIEGECFLAKPFEAEELLTMIKRMI